MQHNQDPTSANLTNQELHEKKRVICQAKWDYWRNPRQIGDGIVQNKEIYEEEHLHMVWQV